VTLSIRKTTSTLEKKAFDSDRDKSLEGAWGREIAPNGVREREEGRKHKSSLEKISRIFNLPLTDDEEELTTLPSASLGMMSAERTASPSS